MTEPDTMRVRARRRGPPGPCWRSTLPRCNRFVLDFIPSTTGSADGALRLLTSTTTPRSTRGIITSTLHPQRRIACVFFFSRYS